MKILYRQQCGSLSDSMKNVKEFSNIKDMFDFIRNSFAINGNYPFNLEEIRISYYGYDNRIDWETYIVTIDRFFNDDYLRKHNCPQGIGFMTFKYDR